MAAEQITPETAPEKREASRARRLLPYLLDLLRRKFALLLRVQDAYKPEIYRTVFAGAEIADLNYWLETIFSMGIATLGLIISSPAVVIGAMLISPLMGPITGSGLALALGDFYLGIKSFLNVALSAAFSIMLAALITWVLPFHTPTAEILARTQPTLLDLGIAVLSGLAGAMVVCRGGRGGGITAMPGVAVAVSLMPPLCVVGFGVGIGWDWAIISGGGLLFLTNLVAIIFCSFLVFFSVRMDAPAVRKEISEWLQQQENREAFYDAIQRTPVRAMLGRVGTVPQRMLILLIFLLMVGLPLGRAFGRLRDEASIRRAVFSELGKVFPRDSIVQQRVDIGPDLLTVRVVAVLPEGFAEETRRRVEEAMTARGGRPARLQVVDVATREELTQLHLARASAERQPAMASLDELRSELWTRLRPAITAAWPEQSAPLLQAQLIFVEEQTEARLRLTYLASAEIGAAAEEAITRVIRERSGSPALVAQYVRVSNEFAVPARDGANTLARSDREILERVSEVLVAYPRTRCQVAFPGPGSTAGGKRMERRLQVILSFLTGSRVEASRISAEPLKERSGDFILRILPLGQTP